MKIVEVRALPTHTGVNRCTEVSRNLSAVTLCKPLVQSKASAVQTREQSIPEYMHDTCTRTNTTNIFIVGRCCAACARSLRTCASHKGSLGATPPHRAFRHVASVRRRTTPARPASPPPRAPRWSHAVARRCRRRRGRRRTRHRHPLHLAARLPPAAGTASARGRTRA